MSPTESNTSKSHDSSHGSTTPAEDRAHVLALLREFSTVMLSTFLPGPNAWAPEVHSRPMAIARLDEDGTVVFITARDSAKVHAAAARRRGHITVQSATRYAWLSGRLEVRDDRALIRAVWSKANEIWFTGPEDPSAVALLFTPEEAEVWDASGRSGLKFLLEAAKALITGTPSARDEDAEQHVRVAMRATK